MGGGWWCCWKSRVCVGVEGEGKEMDAEISEKVPAPVEVEEML